ncbi:MAG: hypothetical protein AAB227_07515 [Pseudomonadota bacterium]
MKSDAVKLAIAVIFDLLDFTIGRIPGFELLFDIVSGVVAIGLWGWPGLFAFLEITDPTGQVDAFVPIMTMIALSQMGKNKKKSLVPRA